MCSVHTNTRTEQRGNSPAARRHSFRPVSVLCLLTASAFLFGLILFGGITLNNRNAMKPSVAGTKYFASIEIQFGDSLWSIADKYLTDHSPQARDAYIAELKRMNHLSGDRITAGNYLTVFYYGGTPERLADNSAGY